MRLWWQICAESDIGFVGGLPQDFLVASFWLEAWGLDKRHSSGQKVWTNDAQSDEEVREDTAVEEGGDRIFVFFAIFRDKG